LTKDNTHSRTWKSRDYMLHTLCCLQCWTTDRVAVNE